MPIADRPALLPLVLLCALHFSVGAWLQTANLPFGLAFSELFFFALPAALLARSMNFDPRSFLGLAPLRPVAAGLAVLGAIASFFLSGAVNALNRLAVGEELARKFDMVHIFGDLTAPQEAMLAVAVVVIAPVAEELLFRGYLLRVLAARYGTWGGVLATSALFALIHVNPASVVALFALGVVFAWMRLAAGTVWASILAHAVQNGVSTGLVLAGYVESSPDELPLPYALALAAISAPLCWLAIRGLSRARPAAGEDLPVAMVPGEDHAVRLSRVRRPLALAAAAAIVALGLFVAADGGSLVRAARRLEDAGGR